MFSKKFLSKLVATFMVLGMSVPAFAAPQLKDIDNLDSTYQTAINRLVGLKIISGDDNANFNPLKNITRAETAKVLTYALGLGKIKLPTSKSKFTDVKSSDWFAPVVDVAVSKGLIKGYSNGKFGPEDNVTYAQFATLALRALGYNDTDLEGEWPLNYVSKATEIGLFNSLHEVDYSAVATRQDVAVMASNMMDTPTKAELDSSNKSTVGLNNKPRTLLEVVSNALGIEKFTNVVLATKTDDASLATDEVKFVDGTKLDVSLLPEDAKAKLVEGARVTLYKTTDIRVDKDNKPIDKQALLVTDAKYVATKVKLSRDFNLDTLVSTGATGTTANKVWFKNDGSTVEAAAKINSTVSKAVYLNGQFVNDTTSSTKLIDSEEVLRAGTTVTLIANEDTNSDYAVNADDGYSFLIASQSHKAKVMGDNVSATATSVSTGDTDVSLQTTDVAGNPVAITPTFVGDAKALGDIKKYDVTYVTVTPDGKKVTIEDVRKAVTGTVKAKSLVNPMTIQIGDTTYTLGTGVAFPTNSNPVSGDTLTAVLDKDGKTVLGFHDDTAGAPDVSKIGGKTYGIAVSAQVITDSSFPGTNTPAYSGLLVTVKKLDGTTTTIKLNDSIADFNTNYYGKLISVPASPAVTTNSYYATSDLTSAAVLGNGGLNYSKMVGTNFYKYKADGTFVKLNYSDINWTHMASVVGGIGVITKATSAGTTDYSKDDYSYMFILDDGQVSTVSGTNYGLVLAKNGFGATTNAYKVLTKTGVVTVNANANLVLPSFYAPTANAADGTTIAAFSAGTNNNADTVATIVYGSAKYKDGSRVVLKSPIAIVDNNVRLYDATTIPDPSVTPLNAAYATTSIADGVSSSPIIGSTFKVANLEKGTEDSMDSICTYADAAGNILEGDSVVLVVGNSNTNLGTDANKILYALISKQSGKVASAVALNSAATFSVDGVAVTKTIASTVGVYKSTSKVMGTLADIAYNDQVTFVMNPLNGKVVLIVVAK